MGFLKRPRSATRVNAKPTWRERRAAERTAKAEATLVETEQKIHEVADQIRSDLKRLLTRPAGRTRLGRAGIAPNARAAGPRGPAGRRPPSCPDQGGRRRGTQLHARTGVVRGSLSVS